MIEILGRIILGTLGLCFFGCLMCPPLLLISIYFGALEKNAKWRLPGVI